MTIETRPTDPGNPFAASRLKFDVLVRSLCTENTLAMTHSHVESLLKTEGFELLRQLFQDHVDLRTLQEELLPAVTGSDGVDRTHRRSSSRKLETIFGTVEEGRIAYSRPGSGSLHPLDAELNLPPDMFSFGVRRQAAQEAARGSFDAALAELGRTTAASIGKRQLEGLAAKAALDFDAFYSWRAATLPVKDSLRSILVMSFDGKGIVMHTVDLRKETRKAAQKGKRKLKKRLTKGEKKNRKRMATVSAVYTVGRFPRTPDDVMDELRRIKKADKRPKPYRKRVWASVAKEMEEVIREGFEEALSRDPRREKIWVAVVDGNATQIKLMKELAAEFGVTLHIVLDLIHAVEYLWKAAHVFYADGSQEAEDWVSERMRRVLCGEASWVAGGMRRSATNRDLGTKKRKAVDACADYFLNHSDFMQYQDYLAAGLPIASGVIEGACRHLIADRMDLTGARWRLQSAEAVLRLRAIQSSGDFEEYWRFHEAQEAQRNHAALFALPITQHADQAYEAKAS